MAVDVMAINEMAKQESGFIKSMQIEIGKVIVGQENMVQRMLIGLFTNGHVLLEGVPGLAKTLMVKTLAEVLSVQYQRVQFTPDLLPADLIGTMIYNQKNGDFTIKKGPIFTNIVLADEINRAPAKVQSALLEAMAERQVTIGETTFKLGDPFLVLATQNPIEQEGTYPLPEAQVDRFMLKLKITYPSIRDEKTILNRMTEAKIEKVNPVVKPEDILRIRGLVTKIYVDDKIKDYIINIVFATRFPDKHGLNEIKNLIEVGASPRASICLTMAAKANAFLSGRGYVTPEDIKIVAYDILRHRLIITYEAEAEEITSEEIVRRILDKIEVP